MRELRESGWIASKNVGNGRRTVYVLLSEAHGAEADTDAGVNTPATEAGIRCAHCHRPRKAIPACGVCRKCQREIAEEQALRAAREKLGAAATLEELALHCHITRMTSRIARILKRIDKAA